MQNPNMFDYTTVAELSQVLSHYNTEYVLDVLKTMMDARHTPGSIMAPQPNLVAAWETNFKELQVYYNYKEFQDRISEVRRITYTEIIEAICREFHLNFTIDDTVDIYSAAYYLYEFFVANFNQNIIQFISSYIFRERNSLYESLNLAAARKNKDTSTIYGKRIYKDIKLVTINANIDDVVSAICAFDIDMSSIMLSIYPKDKATYMMSLVSPKDDFFKNFYASILQSAIKPILLTEIRFNLQRIAEAHDAVNKAGDNPVITPAT